MKTRDKRKVTNAEAAVLVAITKTDPLVAKSVLDILLLIIEKVNNSIERRMATAEALVAAIKADPSLAKQVVDMLIFVLKGDYQPNDVRIAAAKALKDCIAANEEIRNMAASQLFTDYNPNVRKGVIDGFAKYLVGFAKEEARNGRNPVQFLLDHLEGSQTFMTGGNANKYAVYRQAVQEAIALWMASKEQEFVGTQAMLKQRLETMRDQEMRVHLRIAAWDTLEAATLRVGHEDGVFESVD